MRLFFSSTISYAVICIIVVYMPVQRSEHWLCSSRWLTQHQHKTQSGLTSNVASTFLPRAAPSHALTIGRIDNPLRHYTLDQLDKAATEFAKLIGADPKLFTKAVRVARDPPNWKKVDGLTREEKIALKYEKKNGFFRQPKALITTIVTLVFSAMTQGWIQSVGCSSY